MSRKKKDKEMNYWPAYVDALINVVLNLLFLVGVFTIGLVVLNGEAFNQEKKMAELRVKEMHSTEQLTQEAVNAISILKAMPVMASLAPLTLPTHKNHVGTEQYQVTEIRVSKPRTATRIAAEAEAKSDAIKAEEQAKTVAQSIASGKVVMRVDFDINQYTTPRNFSPSADIVVANKNKYLLLCIADPTNQRMAREAFERLMAVRMSLTQAGVDASQIAIQVAKANDKNSSIPNIDRSVFVIDLQNQ